MSEAEYSVIGGLFLEPSRFDEVALSPDHFSSESLRLVFSAIQEAIARRTPVDVVTIADILDERHRGESWLSLCDRCAQACASTHNILAYAEIVKRDHRNRQTIETAYSLINQIEESKSANIDQAITRLMGLHVEVKNYDHSLAESQKRYIETYEDRGKGLPGISTGFEKLDKKLGGWQKSDLIVAAGRPAMGKTAFGLNSAIKSNARIGLFSLEQGNQQIYERWVSIDGKVPLEAIRGGWAFEQNQLSDRWMVSADRAKNRVFQIYDKPAASLDDIKRQSRKWKHELNIDLIVVDYLQRISGQRGQKKYEIVSESVLGLKELARELDIPVIALAQVSRDVEKRPNKRPGMADISDSGEIEKEADIIITLYRDEVYNKDTQDKGIAEISIIKNRHGGTGTARLSWLGESVSFENMVEEY